MRALQYTVIYAKGTSYTPICTTTQVYRQSFRRLAYSFSKAIESTEAVRMVMDGLQIVALKYFGLRLRPTVSISDHSEGLRTGMAHILTSRPLGEVPEETELPLPHLGDWAHIATYYRKGRLLSKTNPYYDQVWLQLQAVHFAHTKEMKTLIECHIYDVWQEWENNGQVFIHVYACLCVHMH